MNWQPRGVFVAAGVAFGIAGGVFVHGAQQGQGANALGGPVANLLRTGPMGSEPGRIEIVANLPDTFPRELLPAGSTVAAIGSIGSATTVVVASVPASSPFDSIRYQWKLEDAGWIGLTSLRSGFMSGTQFATTMCRGASFLTLSYALGASGERLIRVVVGPNPQRSCAPAAMRPLSDVPIPALELPPGTRTGSMGGSYGIDEFESRARLETSLTGAALAAFFIPQMTAAGWKTLGPPAGDDHLSIARLTSSSRAGDPVTALLIFTALDGTPYVDAVLRVVRNKPVGR